jgi:PIN domain nuclease of toxin-antitoxin system
MLLLDTQTLVWFSSGDRKLGEAARQHVIATAVERVETAVSPISFWEIGHADQKETRDLGMPV